MPKVKVGDINMYYEIHGKGESLVIIPGMTANVGSMFLHIQAFSQDFQVIVYDPRGAGQSDSPAIPYTIGMMTDDLVRLLDAVNVDSAHILGTSMGGMIAQEFTLRYPNKVRSLILACTNCGLAHGVPPNDPETQNFRERLQSLPMEERIIVRLRFNMNQEYIDNNADFIKQIIAKMTEHPTSPQGQKSQMHVELTHDTFDRLPEITAPTLVIHGEADRLIPVENARILAERIPGAELVTFKNLGHLFGIEASEEFNRITLDFLKRHSQQEVGQK